MGLVEGKKVIADIDEVNKEEYQWLKLEKLEKVFIHKTVVIKS